MEGAKSIIIWLQRERKKCIWNDSIFSLSSLFQSSSIILSIRQSLFLRKKMYILYTEDIIPKPCDYNSLKKCIRFFLSLSLVFSKPKIDLRKTKKEDIFIKIPTFLSVFVAKKNHCQFVLIHFFCNHLLYIPSSCSVHKKNLVSATTMENRYNCRLGLLFIDQYYLHEKIDLQTYYTMSFRIAIMVFSHKMPVTLFYAIVQTFGSFCFRSKVRELVQKKLESVMSWWLFLIWWLELLPETKEPSSTMSSLWSYPKK